MIEKDRNIALRSLSELGSLGIVHAKDVKGKVELFNISRVYEDTKEQRRSQARSKDTKSLFLVKTKLAL